LQGGAPSLPSTWRLALHSSHFAEANKADLAEIFGRCRDLATDAANAAAETISS
jgi:hypothetical protein